MRQPTVPLGAVDGNGHTGFLSYVHVVPVSTVFAGAIEDLATQATFLGRREGEDVVLLLDIVAVPAPRLGRRLVFGDGTFGTAVHPLFLDLPVTGQVEDRGGCRRFDAVLPFGPFRLGGRRNLVNGRHQHEEDPRPLDELVVVGVDIGPVVHTAQVEAECVILHRKGLAFVYRIVPGIEELAFGHGPLGIDERDRVFRIIADPRALSHRDLAVELVQVDVRVAFLVHRGQEEAVPVLAVDTAIVVALSGGIAVGHHFFEGEFQIVVVFGGRAESGVGIPAPGFGHRVHQGTTTPFGTRSAPDPGTGDGVFPDQRFRELGHVDGVGAGFPRFRGDRDGRGRPGEVQGFPPGYAGSGMIGKIQGFDLHLGEIIDQVAYQLERDRAGGLVDILHGRQTGLSRELDFQDLVVIVPASFADRRPRILGAGAQQGNDAKGYEEKVAFHGYLILGLRSVSMEGMG